MEQVPGPISFPPSVRLKKRPEFLRLSGNASTCSVRGFLLAWSPNGLRTARLGVTVSKKVGCAVVRNRVKRYIRELFRHNRIHLPAIDINVIARRESAGMDFQTATREIERAFRQIGSTACSNVAYFSSSDSIK